MPVVPSDWVNAFQVDENPSVCLSSGFLSCVDSFTYSGFRMNLFLSPDDIKIKRATLFLLHGPQVKIFCQLEITFGLFGPIFLASCLLNFMACASLILNARILIVL